MIIRGESDLRNHLNEVSIYEVRKATEKIFARVAENKLLQQWSNYYAWALHDIFFYKVASPYFELLPLINKAKTGEIINCYNIPEKYSAVLEQFPGFNIKQELNFKIVLTKFLLPFFNCLLIGYSIISFIFSLFQKKLIGVWTGDYLGKEGVGDPRVAALYLYLKQEQIPYLEFIRTNSVSPQKILSHMFKRKKLAIYYDCIENLLYPKNIKKLVNHQLNQEQQLEQLLVNQANHCLKYQRSSKVFEIIFKALNIKSFICWFLSHRTFSLVTAAKRNHVPTIGFMHGVSVYSYMGHEYMREYKGPAIGPDKFGVWSEYWLQQFYQYSSIYSKNALEISGPINKNHFLLQNVSTKEYVTLISEQSSDPKYIIYYVQELLGRKQKVLLKVRQFGNDPFYVKFKQFYPDILQQLTISHAPVEEVFNISKVVLGTHSTAVIEASKFLVPFAILSTTKWQDYFEIKKTDPPYPAVIETADDLEHLLDSLEKNDFRDYLTHMRNNFFGEHDGIAWIKKQISGSQNP